VPELETSVFVVSRGFRSIRVHDVKHTYGHRLRAADIRLYLKPPQHAAVFCVDEKTAIQALDRLDPVLPLSPGRAARHGFEYKRHGTLSLYAAFNTKTGEVLGKTAARHTSAEFVAFLSDLVVNQPRGKEIHVIADNLSAHKTDLVDEFLTAHPKAHLHFTPTYSSWLNQVELWFAKIERDVIARGVFTSISDLKRKLMRYIRHYNEVPKTVKWKYFDPSRRARAQAEVADLIGGKGGTRTLDPGIMSALLRRPVQQIRSKRMCLQSGTYH
jgi:transposase